MNDLSRRELDVVHLVLRGWSSGQIAEGLRVSQKAVHTYLIRARVKLGLPGRTNGSHRDLFEVAHRHGFISWPQSLTDRPSDSPSGVAVAPVSSKEAPAVLSQESP